MNRTMRNYHVYIMANEARTIYIGESGDLEGRIWEHKTGAVKGFTSRYGLTKLVYADDYDYVRDALDREHQLKGWRRSKKLALINAENPEWEDLAADWYK